MKRFLTIIISISIFIVIFALIQNPQKYIECCLNGIKLWATAVLPSLLPFLFITTLIFQLNLSTKLVKTLSPVGKFLYNANGYGTFVQLMSFISGYPVGVKLISELYSSGKITKDEATKFSLFSSTSGPMFIVGSVGAILFKSKIIGLILLISHIFSAILNGIIFRKIGVYNKVSLKDTHKNNENILYNCAFNSAISSIVVGTFIAIFYVLSEILIDFKILYPFNFLFNVIFKNKEIANGLTFGFIECTKGCFILSTLKGALPISLAEALISFGGLSIIIQSVAFLKGAKANIKLFLFSKVTQMISSFLFCYILCLIFKIS